MKLSLIIAPIVAVVTKAPPSLILLSIRAPLPAISRLRMFRVPVLQREEVRAAEAAGESAA